MIHLKVRRTVRCLGLIASIVAGLGGGSAQAQTAAPVPTAPATTTSPVTTPAPEKAPAATTTPPATAPLTTTPVTPAPVPASPAAPNEKAPTEKAPLGTDAAPPVNTQIEPNGSPGVPENATTENVAVPARPIAMISGQSSYDDAFKSIKTSIDTLTAAVAKAGLTPSGHPITIFSEPDEKGFKYQAAIPLTVKPEGKTDLGEGVKIGSSPAGNAIKFQHRGAYDDIDSTYDVITAYLDAKGLQVNNPYIEEYLTDLKTPDDPNLQVDIYVFMK